MTDSATTDLVVHAPFGGWVLPLAEVPDAVFAKNMLGDGVAIDPTDSTLHAPCAGVVTVITRTKHAITIRADNGAEILLHIGLDTVALDGRGFTVHVAMGQRVAQGDALISFDLALIVKHATSAQTPIVIVNSDQFEIVKRQEDCDLLAAAPLFVVRARLVATANESAVKPPMTREIVIKLPQGIHARPAAQLAALARQFVAFVELARGERRATLRSPTALMGLGVECDDVVTISASGADAAEALAAVEKALQSHGSEHATQPKPKAQALAVRESTNTHLYGVVAAHGFAIGPVHQLNTAMPAFVEKGAGIEVEQAKFLGARTRVSSELTSATERAGGDAQRGILHAHLALLDDPLLIDAANDTIASGKSAAFAWSVAIDQQVELLHRTTNAHIAERAADLNDLKLQVVRALVDPSSAYREAIKPGSILFADELLPSQLLALAPGVLAGFCTARGGPTSHVAILAAALGIPALVAAGSATLQVSNGTVVILDAELAEVHVEPSAGELQVARSRVDSDLALREQNRALASEDCRMADGARIEVVANLGSIVDAEHAVREGAEGCGLLRTEFLFLNRAAAPTEAEQLECYQRIATNLKNRAVIVRTLDIGGDKMATYMRMPSEENPALGVRGVRVSLANPELLRSQLRAILRVQPLGACKIMIPMVSHLSELRAVRAILDNEAIELRIDIAKVELGVMIETPAAAMIAADLATEADFLSIGTNDLTQYTLAMDRGNSTLAGQIDSLHPAVLRLIDMAAQGARKRGRWIGVCGGLAADLAAVPILLGLGITELSVPPSRVAAVKARVRALTLEHCRQIAAQALLLSSAADVRSLMSKH